MKRLVMLSPFLLLMLFSASVYAQKNSDTPITVKDDEFTGKRTVELAPQRISPTLTMSITG